MYDLKAPPHARPTQFWDEIGSIDKFIGSCDRLGLLTTDFLVRSYGYPESSAHRSFWTDRAQGKRTWPVPPELLLGDVGQSEGLTLSEYAGALRRSVLLSDDGRMIRDRIVGPCELTGFGGEISRDGWFGAESYLELDLGKGVQALEIRLDPSEAPAPKTVRIRVETGSDNSDVREVLLAPQALASCVFAIDGQDCPKIRVVFTSETSQSPPDPRELGFILVQLYCRPRAEAPV